MHQSPSRYATFYEYCCAIFTRYILYYVITATSIITKAELIDLVYTLSTSLNLLRPDIS